MTLSLLGPLRDLRIYLILSCRGDKNCLKKRKRKSSRRVGKKELIRESNRAFKVFLLAGRKKRRQKRQ